MTSLFNVFCNKYSLCPVKKLIIHLVRRISTEISLLIGDLNEGDNKVIPNYLEVYERNF